jgi:hypothetical protein
LLYLHEKVEILVAVDNKMQFPPAWFLWKNGCLMIKLKDICVYQSLTAHPGESQGQFANRPCSSDRGMK